MTRKFPRRGLLKTGLLGLGLGSYVGVTTARQGRQPSHTLTVETFEGGPLVKYEFTVDGAVTKGPEADDNDTITTETGTTRVTGEVGNGFPDDYRVGTRPSNWSANVAAQHYRVLFDGTEIDPGGGTSGSPGGQNDSGAESRTTNMPGNSPYNSISRMPDGSLLVSGAREVSYPEFAHDQFQSLQHGWTRKLDTSGEPIWSGTYAPPPFRNISSEFGFEAVWPNHSTFEFALVARGGETLQVASYFSGSVSAYESWIVKIDADGTKRWEIFSDDSFSAGTYGERLLDGVVTDSGNYLLVGRASGGVAKDREQSDGWAVLLSPDGTVLWNRLYNPREEEYDSHFGDDPEHDDFHAVTASSDGNYLVAGEAFGTRGTPAAADSPAVGWIASLSLTGEKRWERTYGDGAKNLQFVDILGWDDDYILATQAGTVLKIDPGGDVLWQTPTEIDCHGLVDTGTGSVMVFGTEDGRAAAARVRGDGTQVERVVQLDVESEFRGGVAVGDGLTFVGATPGGDSFSSESDALFVTVGQGPPEPPKGQNTLTVTKEGAEDGLARFLVASSGGVTPAESGEGVTTGTATLDWLGPTGGTDTHLIQSEPETFLLKGPATVRWNGTTVDPGQLGRTGGQGGASGLSDRLRVESTGTGVGHFAVSTSGGIAPTDTAEAATDGISAVDAVGPERGTDAFRFGGEITRFLTGGNVRVFVNDSEVDPASL